MAANRCPACRKHFETLADEVGTHECPHCGHGHGPDFPWVMELSSKEEKEEDDSWLWEKEAEVAEAMNEELERMEDEEEMEMDDSGGDEETLPEGSRKEGADEGDW